MKNGVDLQVGGAEHDLKDSGRVKVLLIDDDAQSRRELRAVLERGVGKADVVEIRNHVGFFKAIQQPDFDLVITAQELHWSSGREVLTAVKSLRPMIPVIMVADEDDEEVAAAALDDGLDAYVPGVGEHPSRLASAVRTALNLIDYEGRVVSLEERLQLLLDRLNVGVFRCTSDGELIEANPAFLRLLGVETLEAAQRVGLDSALSSRSELVEQLLKEGHVRDAKMPLERPDGTTHWVALTQTLETTDEGERFIDGLAEDVTAAHKGEEALRQANDHYRTIFEVTSAATAIIDADGTVAMVNTAFEELSGYARDQIEGKMVWTEFLARSDVDEALDRHRQRIEHGAATQETVRFDFVDREGRTLHVASTEAVLPGSRRTVVSLLNLTERQQAEEQLLHDAFHDALTSLPNRNALMERIQAVMEDTSEGYALLACRLDRYRALVHGLGTEGADELVKGVAERLRATVGGNSFLACTGGDSFGVLMQPIYAPDQAEVVAGGLVEALADSFAVDGQQVFASASIGIVVGEGPGAPEQIVRDAEMAVDEACRMGGQQVTVFDPGVRERAVQSQTIENTLRRSFRSNELRVRYQPIVRLDNGEIVGFESLLRWPARASEVADPRTFLDVAEECGVIVPIGRWVLETACQQLRAWIDGGAARQLFVSVNLGRLQLLQPDTVSTVGGVLRRERLEPSNLMLEVRLDDLGETSVDAALTELSDLGSMVSVDGLSTKMLVRAQARTPSVSAVKIDGSLMDLLESEAGSRPIAAMISAARELGIQVIAQGIERPDQIEPLMEVECNLGQGDLFAQPVDGETASQLMMGRLTW